MNTFDQAHELTKARSRILRLYGQQKITEAQHDVGLQLLTVLGQVLVQPQAAEKVRDALANVLPAGDGHVNTAKN